MKFPGWVIFTGLLALAIPRTDGQNTACVPEGALQPNDNDCFAFRYCTNGKWTDKKCLKGYYFDRNKLACRSNEGQCGSPPVVTPPPLVTPPPVVTPPTQDCGSLPDGAPIAVPGSDIDYYLCIGGSPVKGKCLAGYIFNPISTVCQNPCGVYHPVPNTGTYYVGSPSSESGYYTCTGGKFGSLQQCPASTQFYPALGSLSPPASCRNPNSVNKLCPANAYAAIPLSANPSCQNFNFTPYYVLCNNGVAKIQRCPLGSLINDSGYCTATSLNCKVISAPSIVSSCICG